MASLTGNHGSFMERVSWNKYNIIIYIYILCAWHIVMYMIVYVYVYVYIYIDIIVYIHSIVYI